MTHAEMSELYELYALGVLEPELAAEIERHLEEQCEFCWEHLSAAVAVTTALASVAEPEAAPARVRERVLAAVRPPRAARRWSFAVVALAAACLALVAFSVTSRVAMQRMQAQLAGLTQERNQLRSAVEILSRPETRTVEFGRTENVPHGRVLVNRTGGFVFVGSQLPPLGGDRTFELWLVPASGAAPTPAGLFRPDQSGNSVHVSSLAVDARTTTAVAVSVEPQQGSSAPTTKPFLIVPLA
ncbi:MAG TPA: anti-sigma factor [Bryobacteraceae bacterium]|jgi:anti-sigma-K factor RskA|nr:anti-sigma factor [Bryobacteraceae bacterium]